jgi:hypothetical protein
MIRLEGVMKIEWSKTVSSPDGLVALAIGAALLQEFQAQYQRKLLTRAAEHLGKLDPVAMNPKEARRMIEEMIKQYSSV